MNALVTGGGGFLGLYIVEQLIARGWRVRVLCRGIYPQLDALGVETLQGSLVDLESAIRACQGMDVVYHVAGATGIWGPWKRFYDVNVRGTKNIVEGCRRHGVGRLIYTSSPSVTFNAADQCGMDESAPYADRWLCHYPRSKAMAEQHVLAANGRDGMLTCAMRPHLIWGPRDRHLIPRLLARARTGRLRRVGDGHNLIDTVYVENAARAHLQAADSLHDGSPSAGRAYFISQAEPVNCWDWINEILALAGLPPVEKSISARAAWRLGTVLEGVWRLLRLKGEPPMTRFLAAQLSTSHYFNIARARNDFGYQPLVSTEEGMQRMAATNFHSDADGNNSLSQNHQFRLPRSGDFQLSDSFGTGSKNSRPVNVAARLSEMAGRMSEAVAVVEPRGYGRDKKRRYRQVSFHQLDEQSDRIACGLRAMGIPKGTRLALLVRPGVDFVCLVFALMKAGTVAILIDPGMGRGNMIRCLEEAEPEGFVGIPAAHVARLIFRRRFAKARFNVTVGRRWFWGGRSLEDLRRNSPHGQALVPTAADDPAAIIFTTGSTGPPKGVLYSHGNFDAQVEEIRDFYGIKPGEVDLSCFPLFGLFNCAMGVTTVIPDMDPSRPAQADPAKILEAADDWQATQTFGSPAVWNSVGRYCEKHGRGMSSVRRVLSAGAPVPVHVLQRMKACIHEHGDMHTPYGATESLPVASIAASEVLAETAAKTAQGGGVCVGRHFPGISWKVIRAVDGPIRSIEEAEELPRGEIGELIVSGRVATRGYLNRPEATALAKIADSSGAANGFWHRMGDVGYLDEEDRFWFCGRMAHRVLTADGPMYTVRCEAVFNRHRSIYRSALAGVGPAGRQQPAIFLEPEPGQMPKNRQQRERLLEEIRRLGRSSPLTVRIDSFHLCESLPVDIRHNAKIFREKLAARLEASQTRSETFADNNTCSNKEDKR